LADAILEDLEKNYPELAIQWRQLYADIALATDNGSGGFDGNLKPSDIDFLAKRWQTSRQDVLAGVAQYVGFIAAYKNSGIVS